MNVESFLFSHFPDIEEPRLSKVRKWIETGELEELRKGGNTYLFSTLFASNVLSIQVSY